jgi:DNA-binding XRE family transcriptional regulator
MNNMSRRSSYDEMTGSELKQWRKKLGLTQAEAAEKLVVSRVTVQNWEGGATPIPPSLRSFCNELTRRWKQRKSDYGPVALIYADGPMCQPLWGPARVPMMHREPWPTMKDALKRAKELVGCDNIYNLLVLDDEQTIWNSTELKRECKSEASTDRKARRQ